MKTGSDQVSRHRTTFFVATLLVAAWVYACGDGAVAPAALQSGRPATVTVAPTAVVLSALGTTVQLNAGVRDPNGHVVTDAAVAWTSSDASVVTVTASGLAMAAGNGTATITATAGSASGTATVTVAQEVASVAMSPPAVTVSLGDTLRLVAEASDDNGHAVAGTEFAWSSSEVSVVRVDASGLVTGLAEGLAMVTATAGSVSGTAAVTVTREVDSVTVSPLAATILPGDTVRLTAEGYDENGHAVTRAEFAWSSSDVSLVRVDASGLVTGLAEGLAMVTATAGSASATAMVTVARRIASVTVSPAADTISPGDTLRLTAEAYDENGQALAGVEFGWSSSDASVARVDASGLVLGVAEGRTTVTATARDARGTSGITVENPDRAVLVALYNTTGGPHWVNDENWLTNAPLGEWYGVGTDRFGRVETLDLAGRWDNENRQWVPHGLSGPIPSELGNLTELEQLFLVINDLSGPIPRELGNLASLEILGLWNNDLSGPIPSELGNLTSLEFLNLRYNDLSGSIPSELANLASLEVLDLDYNKLSGPIPFELGNLAVLEKLSLHGNNLSGPIPSELGNLGILETLGLWDNELSGPIPSELGNLVILENLSLGYNNLSGPIPSELGDLAILKILELNDNNLSGPIPSELGNLAILEYLNLRSNDLSGPIPASFLNLSLESFHWHPNAGLCAPDTAAFRAWLGGIERHTPGPFCAGSGTGTVTIGRSSLPQPSASSGAYGRVPGTMIPPRFVPRAMFP